MSQKRTSPYTHTHTFGQDEVRAGERKTLLVIAITATMMVVEIITGSLFGSLALLADGIHMASHTAALLIAAVAYIYARRNAGSQHYSFGTGKVNALAGFSSAIILAIFALSMVWESIQRFISPVEIEFNQAILVAAIGLVVNVACALILNSGGHSHDHDHDHEHHHHSHEDHNLRSAYLHVIADALTSVLAIFALLGGKYFNLVWMDPLMGIVGAVMVSRWAFGLMRDTSRVLLDRQVSADLQAKIVQAIEDGRGDRVSDLHIWAIGPGIYAAILAVVSAQPRSPQAYKALLPEHLGIVHASVEVHHAPDADL